jgi:plasmid stabilization system protein ParE
MRAVYTSRAATELEGAYHWYESRSPGLGDGFLDEVEAAIDRIRDNPELFAPVRRGLRRCLTRRLPFSVIYAIEPDRLVIHAVFDNRRDPRASP